MIINKKRIKGLAILLFTMLISFAKTAEATHVAGADFNYQCVGQNTFLLTFNFFYDCNGIPPAPATINASFDSPCGVMPNVVLNMQAPFGQEVSQLCPSDLLNSTCNGGALPGIQHYIYSGLIVLNPTCDSWTISTSINARNPSANLVGQATFFLTTTINTAADSCNNSPVFNAQPVPYVCQNQIVNYNFGVSEVDGDSLVYTLASPLSGSVNGVNTAVNHIPGFTANSPIPGCVLNSSTGQLMFIPLIQGSYVVAVQVCEYEYGTGILLGCVTRDIQFIVIPCTNIPPTYAGFKNFSGAGNLIDSLTIEVCVGNTFSFDLEFPDADILDTVDITSNITTVLPGAIVTITRGNPAIMNVTWTTQPGTSPFNVFSVSATDDACPLFGLVSSSYVIQVIKSTYAGPDKSVCKGVEWSPLQATGGTVFNWSVLSGSPIDTIPTSPTYNMTCQNCDAPVVSPQQTTTYIVTSNLSSSCRNTDTITITAAANYIAFAGPDTVVCTLDSMQLDASTSIPGVYTYSWSNRAQLSDFSVQNPKAFSSVTSTYNVTVTSSDGCIKTASNTIGKVPTIPIPTIEATPLNICQFGDSSNLRVDLGPNFSAICDGSLSPCGNQGYTTDILLDFDPADGTAGPVTTMTATQFPAPFGNSKRSSKQQYLYLASELQDMGLQMGMITELGFFVTTINGTTSYSNYSMSIGCNPSLSMPGTSFPGTGLVNVLSPRTVNITTGWNMLVFSTPYIWDGVSNLIVEICFDNRDFPASQNSLVRTREFKTTTPGGQQFSPTISFSVDSAEACLSQMALGFGNGNSFIRPDTRFTFCYGYDPAGYDYTWWPNKAINDTTIQAPSVWPDSTTTYNVILADTFGVCADTTSIEISVAHFEAGPDTLICAGDTIQLQPKVFDNCTGFPPIVYWYTTSGIGLISINGMVPTVSVDTTTVFHVQYTNFCGCVVDDSVTVWVNKMYPANLTFTEPNCGMFDGAILVQNNGGTAPFTYSADSGQSFLIDSLFTNLGMGVYGTQYMDGNGCLSPLRSDTLMNVNTAIIDSIITNTPLCYSTATGIIEIYFTGGQSPHTFSIDGGTSWSANSVFNNLLSGTYQVLAQDVNGCISWPETVTLASNNPLLLDSIQHTDLLCFNDSSGTISVFGHGGTPPYTYSADSGFTFQSSNLFTTLQADSFHIVIMDSVGCTTTPVVETILNAPEVTASFSIINDSCFNSCGGAATVSVTGAALPLNYSWRKGLNIIGSNLQLVDGLCAGTDYEVGVTDANNCTQFFPFTIMQPDELIASAIPVNSTCFGSSNGSISVSGTGGIPPYRYSINNGATFSANNSFTGLPAGTYAIMVSDSADRCMASTTVTIIEPNEITLTTNIVNEQICISGCKELIATATGGSGGPFQYIWSHGFDSTATQIGCPTETTVYSVYAIDLFGCTSAPKTITLSLFDSIQLDSILPITICIGSSANLSVNAQGGNGQGYNYQWTPVAGLSNAFVANPQVQPLTNMVYTVKVTDNCETPAAYQTVAVNLHVDPVIDFFTLDSTSGCEPFNITLTNSSTPIQFAEWTITNAEQQFTAHGFEVDLTDLNAGIYDVNLHITTPFGCEKDLLKTAVFEVFPLPIAQFNMDPDQTTVFNTNIQFEDISIGNIQGWEWDFASFGSSNEQHPLYQFPADSGTFPITLTVATDKSCTDDVTELLRVGSEFNMYVPNSFTPNGDAQNDVFAPRGMGIDPNEYRLEIYDRWGGIIFESSDLNQPWDGRVQGTTKMAQNGIYIWKIVAIDITDERENRTYTGTVNLIR